MISNLPVPEVLNPSPTEIVQVFPDLRLPSQVFDWVKGEVVPMPVMLRFALPKSVKVIGPGGLKRHAQGPQ